MALSIEITGLAEVIANLQVAADKAQTVLAAELYQEGERIMTEAKALTPFLTGTLKNSGHVELPQISGSDVSVKLGFGGAAEDYAIVQHEDLTFHHPRGGQAKFLEQPFLEHGKTLPEVLADRVKAALGA